MIRTLERDWDRTPARQSLSQPRSLASRGGGGAPAGSLTVKEKILLHLFDFNRFADAFEAPAEVTQNGIAKAVGIRVPHVPQYVKPLLSEGLLDERTGHVVRQARRLKVYFLTDRGRSRVATMRGGLLRTEVPFRDRTGEIRSVPLAQIVQEERRDAGLLQLLREIESAGFVLEAPSATAATSVVDFAQEAPRIDRCYGRDRDVAQVLEAWKRAPVVVVIGMAGVGKTTLGAQVVERLRGTRSVYWRQIRSWDTGIDLAFRLSTFLQALGRPALHATLVGSGPKSLSRIEELLEADLAGRDAVLVFDDVQDATDESQEFLAVLLRVLRGRTGVSLLLLSRTTPSLYSRREVDLDHSIVELPVRGIDRESARRLLADAGVDGSQIDGLLQIGGGNPLYLKLLGSSGSGGTASGQRTLAMYLSEQVEPALTPTERGCLEVGALYQVAVPEEGLLLERSTSRTDILNLLRKGLIDPTGSDRYVVHDTLRSYLLGGLSADRQEALSREVAAWLVSRAQDAAAGGDPSQAIGYLENALSVDADPGRRLSAFEQLGRLRSRLGDLRGAIDAYRAGFLATSDALSRAKFHRLLAHGLMAEGELEAAEGEVEAGLRLLPDPPSTETGWLLLQRALVAYRRQDFSGTARLVEQIEGALSGLPRDPELWGHLVNLKGLLDLEDPHPDYPRAEVAFTEAIAAFTQVGYQTGLAGVHNNLALAQGYQGKAEVALANFDRSLEFAKGVGDLRTMLTALWSKAGTLAETVGDYEAAEAAFRQTHDLGKQLAEREDLAFIRRDIAVLYFLEGRLDEAREAHEYFVSSSGEFLNVDNRVSALGLLARICVLCGDPKSAEEQLRAAETLLPESSSEFAAQAVAWARASLLAAGDQAALAESEFDRAYHLSAGSDRGKFLLDYGRFLVSIGKPEHARPVLEEASKELAWSKPLGQMAQEALRGTERPLRLPRSGPRDPP